MVGEAMTVDLNRIKAGDRVVWTGFSRPSRQINYGDEFTVRGTTDLSVLLQNVEGTVHTTDVTLASEVAQAEPEQTGMQKLDAARKDLARIAIELENLVEDARAHPRTDLRLTRGIGIIRKVAGTADLLSMQLEAVRDA